MQEKILITAVGKDEPGIVEALTEFIANRQGSLEESRMAVLGGEFAIILLVSSVKPEALDDIEGSQAQLKKKTGLNIDMRRTSAKSVGKDVVRYEVQTESMDNPGIVHGITEFFASRNINIESLSTETYAAAHSGTLMFSLEIIVLIPVDQDVEVLRQTFISFCDDQMIDASIKEI